MLHYNLLADIHVLYFRLGVMSIAFLLSSKDDAVVWRGPKKNAMIKQFLSDVFWGDIDYLVIDTPPGTSDEHITVGEHPQWISPKHIIVVSMHEYFRVFTLKNIILFHWQSPPTPKFTAFNFGFSEIILPL